MDFAIYPEWATQVHIYDREGNADNSVVFNAQAYLNRISDQYRKLATPVPDPVKLCPAFDAKHGALDLTCEGVPNNSSTNWWGALMSYPTFVGFIAPDAGSTAAAAPAESQQWMDALVGLCDITAMTGVFCDTTYFGSSMEVIATMILAGAVKKGGPPPPPPMAAATQEDVAANPAVSATSVEFATPAAPATSAASATPAASATTAATAASAAGAAGAAATTTVAAAAPTAAVAPVTAAASSAYGEEVVAPAAGAVSAVISDATVAGSQEGLATGALRQRAGVGAARKGVQALLGLVAMLSVPLCVVGAALRPRLLRGEEGRVRALSSRALATTYQSLEDRSNSPVAMATA